jgi:hypothetical protein
MDEHLGIGLRAKDVAVRLERFLQVAKVVDLAVECDPDRAVLIRHRLRAQRGEIDDR